MPRGRKKSSPTASGPKGQTLRLETDNLKLVIESADSNLIERLLNQLDWTDGAKGSAPRATKGRRGRPPGSKNKPKAATKQVETAPSTGVTKTAVRGVLANAKPTNHEQRILMVGLAAERSAAQAFTTAEVQSNAKEIGVTASTIPGSLSKLKKAGMLTASRVGRSAFYALTAKGRELAERIAQGEVVSSRRGRKPGAKGKKTAAKKAAKPGRKPGRPAKKKPGPKPKAKKAAASSAAPKRRGRKPGPKPGTKKTAAKGAKTAKAPKAKGKKRGPAKGSPRPAATLESLPAGDQTAAKKMVGTSINADEKTRFDRLKSPRDRALYILQRFGSEVSGGMTPSLISYVLSTRHSVTAPANGVGAALKKTLPSKLVSQNAAGRYSITVDGRNHLEAAMSK